MALSYSLNYAVRQHKKVIQKMDESVMEVNVPTVDAADSTEYVDV
jgi:hypothetical protein